MAPDPDILQTLVQRIVEVAQPLRIVLLGSAARGEMGPKSDLDALVVMPDGTDCRRTAMRLYRDIRGVRFPFDLVVATPALVARHSHTPGLVYRHILEEGTELYAA
jgi:predicted nucleotidyltransferase